MTEPIRQLARAERAYLKRAQSEWDSRNTEHKDDWCSNYREELWQSFNCGDDGLFYEAMANISRDYEGIADAVANNDLCALGHIALEILTDHIVWCANDAYENNFE